LNTTFTTGSRYLGFIGERKLRILDSRKVAKWADAVEELASVAVTTRNLLIPQKSLQQEWQFVQSLRILVMLSPTLRKQFPNHSFQLFG
jgi:hypothetical protein